MNQSKNKLPHASYSISEKLRRHVSPEKRVKKSMTERIKFPVEINIFLIKILLQEIIFLLKVSSIDN